MGNTADEPLTLGQVCAFLRINRETLAKLETAGSIRILRPPVGRPKVMRSEMEAFIQRYQQGQSGASASA